MTTRIRTHTSLACEMIEYIFKCVRVVCTHHIVDVYYIFISRCHRRLRLRFRSARALTMLIRIRERAVTIDADDDPPWKKRGIMKGDAPRSKKL